MAEVSAIEWTDATWNPWQGCDKVSPGCAHCYMYRDMARYGKRPDVVRRSAAATFRLPLKRDRRGEWKIPSGSKVFCCSWSDWFHASADPWREEAWEITRQRPDLIFQIVTKRTERIQDCLPTDWGRGYPNVWLLATAEDQHWLERRLPDLVRIPAVVRGLSIEPLLGPVDLQQYLARYRSRVSGLCYTNRHAAGDCDVLPVGIDWVIVGGESGPDSRPLHPDWVRLIRDQCLSAGVPFFFKQWGEWAPHGDRDDRLWRWGHGRYADWFTRHDGTKAWHFSAFRGTQTVAARVGKKSAGRLLDGKDWSQFPTVLSHGWNTDQTRI